MRSQDDLKALKKEWYLKLKEEGFRDLENVSHPDSPLIDFVKHKFRRVTIDNLEETREYYSKAKELLQTYCFDNETQKEIWSLHSDGFSKRKIEKCLQNSPKALKREAIGLIITQLATLIK